MGIRTFLAAAAFLTTTATASSAATILYDFTENLGDGANIVTYSQDGVELTVTATGGDGVNRGNNGLGVTGNPEGGRLALFEGLTFGFDQDITSVTATIFEAGGQDESFVLFGLGAISFETIAGAPGNSFTDFTSTFSDATNGFGIFGLSPNGNGNRGVRISSIEVTLAAVPLPAGGALLATGLLGLGMMRRKKKS